MSFWGKIGLKILGLHLCLSSVSSVYGKGYLTMDEFSGTDCRRWIKLSCLKTAYKMLGQSKSKSAADMLILGSGSIRLERNKITFCFEKVQYNITNIMYNTIVQCY